MSSCDSESQTPQTDAEKMIAEALANAKRMEEEALAKAAALTAEVEANVEQKQKDLEAEKIKKAEDAKALQNEKTAALKVPGTGLDKYNGFYLNNRNNDRGFILVNGKLAHFNFSVPTSAVKDEEYIIDGLTAEHEFNIKAQYTTTRNGVELKEVLLRDVKPIIEGSSCTQLERAGRTFVRMNSFREFMETKNLNYKVVDLIKDYKAKYNRSDAEIKKGLDRPDFFKADFFTTAPFQGDRMPLIDALEAICKM